MRLGWVEDNLLTPLAQIQQQVADQLTGAHTDLLVFNASCSGGDPMALCAGGRPGLSRRLGRAPARRGARAARHVRAVQDRLGGIARRHLPGNAHPDRRHRRPARPPPRLPALARIAPLAASSPSGLSHQDPSEVNGASPSRRRRPRVRLDRQSSSPMPASSVPRCFGGVVGLAAARAVAARGPRDVRRRTPAAPGTELTGSRPPEACPACPR